MVFHVLLMRDLCLSTDEAIEQETRNVKAWSDKLVARFRKDLADKSSLYGLDKDILIFYDTDREAQIAVIKAIQSNQIVLKEQIAGESYERDIDPVTLQRLFDRIASKIRMIQANEEKPQGAFYIGLAGVAINLGLLVCYALLGINASYLRVLVGTAVIVNLGLGIRFTKQIRGALTCYY